MNTSFSNFLILISNTANSIGITHKSKSSPRHSMITRMQRVHEAKKPQVCSVAPSHSLSLGPALQDPSHMSNTCVLSLTVKHLLLLRSFFTPDFVKEKTSVWCCRVLTAFLHPSCLLRSSPFYEGVGPVQAQNLPQRRESTTI